MGHWCRICGRSRPNEKFSGKGHKNHICKECSSKPKDEIEAIDQTEEIFNFLSQSRISEKNIARLDALKQSANKRISELAAVIQEVARACPHKRRRLKFLAKEHKPLLQKLIETGVLLPWE